MGRVLHDGDLGTARLLLARVRDLLPVGGLLLICEAIVDEERRAAAHALLASLSIPLATGDGTESTAAACEPWLSDAGFIVEQSLPSAAPLSAILAPHVAAAGDRHA